MENRTGLLDTATTTTTTTIQYHPAELKAVGKRVGKGYEGKAIITHTHTPLEYTLVAHYNTTQHNTVT